MLRRPDSLTRPSTAALVCLVVGSLVVSGCFGCNNTSTANTPGPGGGNAAPAGNTIPVGAYLSLTGDEADFGKSTQEGIQVAVDQINSGGGLDVQENGKSVKKKIEFTTENDESDASKAASAVTKLITSNKVVAVIGEIASGRSLAAAPICQTNQVPMVSPSSTNVKVTQAGDYIFRVCFIDSFQGYVLAKFAHDTLKATKAAMLIDNSSAYSRDLGAGFKTQFEQLGGKIVEEAEYSPTDIDFKGQLSKIKAAAPDVILVPGYYKSVGAIGKQAKESGITATLLGGDGWDSQDLFVTAGDSLEGSYLSDHMDINGDKPEVKQFVADFKAKFPDRKPGALTALGYDAMMIVADAMKRAKSISGPDIRDALAQTKDFKGVTGDITINKDRNADKPAVILQVKGHDFKYVTSIAQPK